VPKKDNQPQPSVESSQDLRISKAARHLVVPEGIVDTIWYEVADRCAEWGDAFDTWQDGLGTVALGITDKGKFAATVGGITLSIPRQVAKTFLVGRIVFALATLYPGTTILWTAHHGATSTNSFTSLANLAAMPAAKKYVRTVRNANGEQQIRFKNGSVLMVGARGQGFGRGFTKVDIAVFDEAQILTEAALEDMVPATNQGKAIPYGALLFFMGTPPRPKDPGEEFSARRKDALALKAPNEIMAVAGDALYVEFAADENVGKPGGPGLMDEAQIRKANPSFPHRTPWESILRMRRNLKSDDSWRREALGVWDGEGIATWQLIDRKTWDGLAITQPPDDGEITFGIKFSSDAERVGLAAAIRCAITGDVFVETIGIYHVSNGISSIVKWLAKPERWQTCARIIIDGKAGAPDMVDKLKAAGIPMLKIQDWSTQTNKAFGAHQSFLGALNEGQLNHSNQDGLTDAIKHAEKRFVGKSGGFGWQPTHESKNVTALDAATLAYGGLGPLTKPKKKKAVVW